MTIMVKGLVVSGEGLWVDFLTQAEAVIRQHKAMRIAEIRFIIAYFFEIIYNYYAKGLHISKKSSTFASRSATTLQRFIPLR